MALSGLFVAITPAANGIPRADGTGLIDLGWVFAAKGANTVFAGPASGSDAMPGFRALVADDIPDLSSIYVPIGRKVDTGDGLTGGGDLSADRTLSVTGNLLTLFDLADGSGWLHNDGSGGLAYSTPTPAEIGLSAGNSITLTGGVIDTIQDIRTSAHPQFARLDIGAGTPPGVLFRISESGESGLEITLPDGGARVLAESYNRSLSEYIPLEIISSNVHVRRSGSIGSTTASTSPTTGALVVAGGVGVGGAVIANSYIKTVGYVVSALPSAATAGAGAITLVTNATNAAGTDLGVIPTGGGSVNRMVYSDGSDWRLL